MVFVTPSLLLACLLPLGASAIKLNTPSTTASNGDLALTWQVTAGDPTLAMFLVGSETVDIATGVNPAAGNQTIKLGEVVPGTYTVQARNGDDIEKIIDTSGQFQITAASATGSASSGNTAVVDNSGSGGNAASTSTGSNTNTSGNNGNKNNGNKNQGKKNQGKKTQGKNGKEKGKGKGKNGKKNGQGKKQQNGKQQQGKQQQGKGKGKRSRSPLARLPRSFW